MADSFKQPALAIAKRAPSARWRVVIYLVLIGGAFLSVLPFVYMLMTSLKSYGSVINNTFWPWPPFGDEMPQFNNFVDAVQAVGMDTTWHIPLFFRYLANSLIVSSAIIVGVLLTSTLAAYALANMDIPGKHALFLILLATIMIPQDLVIVPKAVMMFDLKWYN